MHGAFQHVWLISSYVTGSRFSSWNSASNVASSPAYITDSRDVLVKSVSSMLGRFFVQPSMPPQGALNSCVADEAKGCHRDEEAPFHRMGAHFALFSPYFHRSTILP